MNDPYEVSAIGNGGQVLIIDGGVDVIHLTPAKALLLARQILEAIAKVTNTEGETK